MKGATKRHTAVAILKLQNWFQIPLEPCSHQMWISFCRCHWLFPHVHSKNCRYINPNTVVDKTGYKWKTTDTWKPWLTKDCYITAARRAYFFIKSGVFWTFRHYKTCSKVSHKIMNKICYIVCILRWFKEYKVKCWSTYQAAQVWTCFQQHFTVPWVNSNNLP
jgi:hypothetical protein